MRAGKRESFDFAVDALHNASSVRAAPGMVLECGI
jgi:hypothetical protein